MYPSKTGTNRPAPLKRAPAQATAPASVAPVRQLTLVSCDHFAKLAMKVAFATESLHSVDAHFGWAGKIAIYEVTPEGHALLEVFQFKGELAEDGSEDKLVPKLEAIRDCAILYVAAIGSYAAAKVVNLKVHLIKVAQPEPIAGLLQKLQTEVAGAPLRSAAIRVQAA
jgi:nitrogen fixation protein NifX